MLLLVAIEAAAPLGCRTQRELVYLLVVGCVWVARVRWVVSPTSLRPCSQRHQGTQKQDVKYLMFHDSAYFIDFYSLSVHIYLMCLVAFLHDVCAGRHIGMGVAVAVAFQHLAIQ